MEQSYTMVAEARGQRVLWYRQFGSYQGEWLLFSRDDDLYYVYKGSYGSCSGCDHLEGYFGYEDEPLTPEHPKVQEFIADYQSFLEMKPDAALRIVERDGNLLHVLPKNRREWYDDDFDHEVVGRQLALVVKYEEGAITAAEILELDNQEIRRAALEKYGAERFATDIEAVEIDREGENVLMRLDRSPEPFAFLYVKDSSTERRYILRVDPAHTTAQAARAASFGMDSERFVLAEET